MVLHVLYAYVVDTNNPTPATLKPNKSCPLILDQCVDSHFKKIPHNNIVLVTRPRIDDKIWSEHANQF
jgi:hypothetical protein